MLWAWFCGENVSLIFFSPLLIITALNLTTILFCYSFLSEFFCFFFFFFEDSEAEELAQTSSSRVPQLCSLVHQWDDGARAMLFAPISLPASFWLAPSLFWSHHPDLVQCDSPRKGFCMGLRDGSAVKSDVKLRTQVQFPPPTWQLTNTGYYRSNGSSALFWLLVLRTWCTSLEERHTKRK